MNTFQVDRFDRQVSKSNGQPFVTLVAEASDLELASPPTSFSMEGKDGLPHTFSLSETNRDGTPDNEIVGWTYTMASRSDVAVKIFND